MRIPIILLSGPAGSGKDATADLLVQHYGATKVAQSDPMKWLAQELFDCRPQDLWGASERRSTPAIKAWLVDRAYGLDAMSSWTDILGIQLRRDLVEWYEAVPTNATLRDVLQTLGTEWGRKRDPDLWINHALKTARQLLGGGFAYVSDLGPYPSPRQTDLVVIPDGRFRNEVLRVRECGGATVRIVSPGAGLTGAAAQHASEVSIAAIPEGWFDFTLVNDRANGLDGLRKQVDHMMRFMEQH